MDTGSVRQDAIQHGGAHYKQFGEIQPWNVVAAWGLGYFDGTVLKYIARWRHKGGVEDLKKARHLIDKLIELEEKEPTPRGPICSGIKAQPTPTVGYHIKVREWAPR